MLRPSRLFLLLALGAFLVVLARLGALEQAGPAHVDLTLDGEIPATLYVPGTPDPARMSPLPDPPPADRRAPAVLLAHGFSADRVMMSTLARRFAANGYVVLALDFRGHGANRNPFPGTWGRPESLQPDLAAALDFLRDSPYVDPARVVLVGHSMGAIAVLDFATREAGVAGVVAISGAWPLLGPYTPPNVLFVYAARDPEPIRVTSTWLAARLAGVEQAEPGRTYGTIANRRAVRTVEVPGENHLSILWSDVAAREMLAWLDGICGVTRTASITLDDPRRRTAGIGLLLAVVLLAGVGQVLGRLAPTPPTQPESGRLAGLGALAVASLATMPLLATGSPFTFLGLEVGDVTVAHMTLSGVAWLGALALLGRLDWAGWRPVFGRSVATGLLAFLAIYALFVPINVAFHRMTPTPERLAAQVLATALLLPYFVAFELAIRRGGTVRATLAALAGRALIVGVAVVGVRVGVLPPVVNLMLPTFVVLFVLFEVVAAPAYSTARNVVAIATLEAAWLAWSIAVAMPIRW